MAQVHYNSNSKTYQLDKTAGDILNELVPTANVQYCELFFHSRKIGREQKLSDIKGIEPGKTLRILERKSNTREQQKAPKDLREQAVTLNNQLKKLPGHLERIIVEDTWKSDYIKNLLEKYPVITEQPALINVLSDFSLIQAMFHEEHGFIQQNPIFIKIIQNMIESYTTDGFGNAQIQEFLRRAGIAPNSTRSTPSSSAAPSSSTSTSSAGLPPPQRQRSVNFTSDMLQQALAQSLVGTVNSDMPGPSSTTTPSNTPAEAMDVDTAQPSNPAENYAAQISQLHEFGFMNDEENIPALIVANGDIEGAIEFIITSRNQMDELD